MAEQLVLLCCSQLSLAYICKGRRWRKKRARNNINCEMSFISTQGILIAK